MELFDNLEQFGMEENVSRNLCTSTCCDNTVRLSDLRGKPIEFRQYGNTNPPVIGTRWDCPTCGVKYFAWWREAREATRYGGFDRGFIIDLSYYATFNDEPDYDGTFDYENDIPGCLCEDNAEDHQTIW